MGNVNALLTQRLSKNEPSSKMAEMAKRSANGNMNSFAGMFSVVELTENEKSFLETLLKSYATDVNSIAGDLKTMLSLTAEVKAINNQAAILHGERIKKAHDILINYKEGAFTSWLVATYGNRQTPYNLMQYYEFYEALPKPVRPQVESMPRQVVYTLASREAALEQKIEFIQGAQGQTKAELLIRIRELFPLGNADKRRSDIGETTLKSLEKICRVLQRKDAHLNKSQKQAMLRLINHLEELVQKS